MSEDKIWFVRKEDKVHGPLTGGQLKQLADSQRIKPDTEVRRGESGSWVAAHKVKGLFTQLALAGPALPSRGSGSDAWPPSESSDDIELKSGERWKAGGKQQKRSELIAAPSVSAPAVAISAPAPALSIAAVPVAAPAVAAPSRVPCPFCGEDIVSTAIKCRHCNEFLDGRPRELPAPPMPSMPSMPMMMPMAQPNVNVNVIQQTHVGVAVQRWSPLVAMLLSFLIPGLGQIYKGQAINGAVWFVIVVIGYLAFVIPGMVLHLCCIVGAGMGDPYR